jgi:hypothetical protein
MITISVVFQVVAFFQNKTKKTCLEISGMKNTPKLSIGLIALIIALVVVNGYLICQNSSFKEKNRELLLQNDSIQSVNLMLSNTIDTVLKKNKSSATNNKLTFR